MNVKNWTVCVVEPNKFEGADHCSICCAMPGVEKVRVVVDKPAATGSLRSLQRQRRHRVVRNGAAGWRRLDRRLPPQPQAARPQGCDFHHVGRVLARMAEECRHAGANALIGKPISAKVLMATINKVLTPAARVHRCRAGYVGPCRRAGIVTAGAPKKRRKADESRPRRAMPTTVKMVVEDARRRGCSAYAVDPHKLEPASARCAKCRLMR